MNKRRILGLGLAALLVCALAGCQLALEDQGTEDREDRLVGVLVTMEYLDLFDMDAYLEDNMRVGWNGELIIDGSEAGYHGRLYATLQAEEVGGGEGQAPVETQRYVFQGVEAIPYFHAVVPATADRDRYFTTESDGAVADGHTSYSQTDEGTSVTLEGTIYVSLNSGERTFYFNPVYQSADGRVYVTSGTGMSSSGDAEGAVSSHTMESTHTVKEDGKAVTYRTSVKITIHPMNKPVKIVLLQMDDESSVLSRSEFEPGKLPEAIAPVAGAGYLVVETYKTDADGKEGVSRMLIAKGVESLDTFYCREDGICVKQWTALEWLE